MVHEIKVDRETFDYEEINGELYIKTKSTVKAIIGMLDKEDYEELLEQGLGLDESGNRV